MPTGAGHYRSALDKCFQALAQAASSATGPVLLMGDFNIDETKLDDSMKSAADPDGVPFYDEWIGPNGYLGKAGLVDAYRRLYGDSKNDPGYTVVSSTNSCWQHFNPEDVAKGTIDNQRIDYMMCRGLTPVSVAVGSDKKWVWKDSDGHTKDISDHYPLLGTFTLGT